MGRRARRATVVLLLGAVLVALALLLGRVTGSQSAASSNRHPAGTRLEHGALFERGEQGDAEAEAYADRAYPATEITTDNIQGALAANANVAKKAAKLTSKWDFIGPDTLDVDRLGTQSFIKPTQWSGRVTALTMDPKCKPQECTLYVGAAGGGVWRSKNALAPTPAWKQISAGTPTNAIGSIAVDPNDPTGRTIYAGNAAGGLLRSTTGGSAGSWTPIFQENRGRFSFAAVKLPNGKTRIYLADASGGGQGAQVYRIDDASQPAAALTAPCAGSPVVC